MRIRTITVFSDSSYNKLEDIFHKASLLKSQAEQIFSSLDIQTIRIALTGAKSHIEHAEDIDSMGSSFNVPFISLGMYDSNTPSSQIIEILDRYENLSLSYNCLSDDETVNCSQIIKGLSERSTMNNFRFAGSINIKPFTPFFPAAYAGDGLSFALGLEWGDLLYSILSENSDMDYLQGIMVKEFSQIEKNCLTLEKESHVEYRGIDMSLNPSVEEKGSVAFAYDNIVSHFGSRGTLALTKTLTDILGSLSITKTGYCGVMFPVLEDKGLAHYWSKRKIDIDKLLLYASVCGCGLDMIPLPGSISPDKIYSIINDLKAISDRYNKPLSARLLPVKGKNSGAATTFESPYLVNTII